MILSVKPQLYTRQHQHRLLRAISSPALPTSCAEGSAATPSLSPVLNHLVAGAACPSIELEFLLLFSCPAGCKVGSSHTPSAFSSLCWVNPPEPPLLHALRSFPSLLDDLHGTCSASSASALSMGGSSWTQTGSQKCCPERNRRFRSDALAEALQPACHHMDQQGSRSPNCSYKPSVWDIKENASNIRHRATQLKVWED